MFEYVLELVLGLALMSVHSASRINPSEWTLIQHVYDALGVLLTKKPATMQ